MPIFKNYIKNTARLESHGISLLWSIDMKGFSATPVEFEILPIFKISGLFIYPEKQHSK
jgi:hypothetical protein